MSTHTKLLLHRSGSPSTTNSNWALYTKVSGTFENTQTSMYAEVISLADTTGYGGASLGNQSERYLLAYAHKTDSLTSSTVAHFGDGTHSIATWLATYADSSTNFTFTPNNETFSTLQSALEDDGQYFFTVSDGGTDEYYALIVDKNNLGNSSGSSGSSVDGYTWNTAYTPSAGAYSNWEFTDPDFPTDTQKVNKITDKIDKVYKDLVDNDYFTSRSDQVTAFLLQQLFLQHGNTIIDKLNKFSEINNNSHYTNI